MKNLVHGVLVFSLVMGISARSFAVDLTNPDPLIAQFGLALDAVFANAPNVLTASTLGEYRECGKGTPGMGVYLDVIYMRQNGKFVPQEVNDKGAYTCSVTGGRLKNIYAKVIATDANNRVISVGEISLSLLKGIPQGYYSYADRTTGKVKACWIPTVIAGCDLNLQF